VENSKGTFGRLLSTKVATSPWNFRWIISYSNVAWRRQGRGIICPNFLFYKFKMRQSVIYKLVMYVMKNCINFIYFMIWKMNERKHELINNTSFDRFHVVLWHQCQKKKVMLLALDLELLRKNWRMRQSNSIRIIEWNTQTSMQTLTQFHITVSIRNLHWLKLQGKPFKMII